MATDSIGDVSSKLPEGIQSNDMRMPEHLQDVDFTPDFVFHAHGRNLPPIEDFDGDLQTRDVVLRDCKQQCIGSR